MNQKNTESTPINPVWGRIISMLVLGVAYTVAQVVLIALIIGQVLFGLFAIKSNDPLKRMGKQVSDYMYEILLFLTFNSEQRPFPYQGWDEKESVAASVPAENPEKG